MARTFVRVELIDGGVDVESFSEAMTDLGFLQTITGGTTRKSLRLPTGMYLIERTNAVRALNLAREAARKANVAVRIFCVPAGGKVSFGNLSFAEAPT